MKIVRTGSAAWQGGIKDGKGNITTESSCGGGWSGALGDGTQATRLSLAPVFNLW